MNHKRPRRGWYRRRWHQDLPGLPNHRLARRRDEQRALVAAGNSILTIAWHLIAALDAQVTGLGWDCAVASPHRRQRPLIAGLERLSAKKVLLREVAA